MLTERPERLIDVICGMSVHVDRAEGSGLLLEYDKRTFAFCSDGCRDSFVTDPIRYLAAVEPAGDLAPTTATGALLVIDEGMRRWYESCSCCLSEAYPDIKAQLDAERAAAARPPVDAGICEVAEAEIAHSH